MQIDEKALTVAVQAFRNAPGNSMWDFLRYTIEAYESAKPKEAEGIKLGSRLTVEGVDAVVVPVEPSDGLLMSMALRRDHGLGNRAYYDALGDGEHDRRLRVALSEARQAQEEVVGKGFYSRERDEFYRAMLSAAGDGR